MSKSIWKFEVMDRYELESLTPVLVEKAEKKFNVSFPTLYLELLQEQNGGSLHLNKFPVTEFEEGFIDVDYLWGIGKSGKQGIYATTYLIKEWGLPKDLVLLNGDGNSWIGLDYRKNPQEPSVVYLESDSDVEITLAANFEEFLSKLYWDENAEDFDPELFADDKTEFTQAEAEEAFADGVVLPISLALLHLTKVETDIDWFLNQIKTLLLHGNTTIVMEAEGALMKILLKHPDKITPLHRQQIKEMLAPMKKQWHWDPDILNYAQKIETKLGQLPF